MGMVEETSVFFELIRRCSERDDRTHHLAAGHCLEAARLITEGSRIRHFSLPGLVSGQRCRDLGCSRLVPDGEGSVCQNCLAEVLVSITEGLIRAGSEILDPDDGQVTGG